MGETTSTKPQGHASNPRMLTEAYLGPLTIVLCLSIQPGLSPERCARYESAADGDLDLNKRRASWLAVSRR